MDMRNLTYEQLRKEYLDFFKSKDHIEIPSASLVPDGDASVLFVNAGMFPLVPFLKGEQHPQGKRLTNSQRCLRTGDIDEVGDKTHCTTFEMLGNWSLNDYFKKEAIEMTVEFFVEVLQFDINRIYASVFEGEGDIPQDNTSIEAWKGIFAKYNIDAKVGKTERIMPLGRADNWWGLPTGGPCGPDSEIFYDFGVDLKKHDNSEWKDLPCHINCDCGRFIEIGNSVFMEYKKTENGFEKLTQQNVDFGGGLERITMASQNTEDVFQTDLYLNIIKKIEELSNKKYSDDKKSFQIIADHLKAVTFIMGDNRGITPSNLGQGYIVRRLIRRAIRFGKQLGIN